jgi:hypothetical protein
MKVVTVKIGQVWEDRDLPHRQLKVVAIEGEHYAICEVVDGRFSDAVAGVRKILLRRLRGGYRLVEFPR